MSYSKQEVKDNIELEDVYTLLDYFDAEPESCGDYLKARTICHNGVGEGSKKLYYYDSTKLFMCYTDCGTFDIFELVQKVKGIEDLNTAIFFVVNFFNLQYKLQETNDFDYSSEDWKVFQRYDALLGEKKEDEKLVLPECGDGVLLHYPQPTIKPWVKDGISKEVCDFANIRYDPLSGSILIPHYDEDGRCVGIRQRTLVRDEEKFGKYRPWKNGRTLYNHPLGFNLYGYNWSKERIKSIGTCIMVEGEKSVLESMSYFGTGNNLCVATCGSNISKYQFNLMKELGIGELVVAFDHDFSQIGSDEYFATEKKIAKVAKKFSSMTKVSVIFDRDGLLGYKQSPLDCGLEKFMYLFKNRIVL